MRLASREKISAILASLTSLARREKCDIFSSLRVLQFESRICETHKQESHNSQREISIRLKILARFSQDYRATRLASLATKFLLQDSQEAIFATKFRSKTPFLRFSLQNFYLWDLQEASLATNFDSPVSRKSRENFGSKKRVSLLARISKSDSRVNPIVEVLIIRGREKMNWLNAIECSLL